MAKGKWQVMANVIGGKMKYIAGRVIDEDEPLHSGNIEHFGEYTEDEAGVQEIADILNKAEVASRKSDVNGAMEETTVREEKPDRPRGWRVLIEDLDSGEVTVYSEAVCIIGAIASIGDGANADGKFPVILSKIGKTRCGSTLVMNGIEECKDLLQDIRREIMEKHCPGIVGKIENLVDEMLNKYRGGDE